MRHNALTREKLIEVLGSKKNLRYLDAQSNKLDAATPVALINELPRLRHLDLSSNPKIGDAGLTRLCHDTACFRLVSLVMANCDFGDEKDASLALKMFLQHPSCRLVKLDLSFNNLGSSFCEQLAQGLHRNRSVRVIRLEHALAYSKCCMEALLSFNTPVHYHELNFARNNLSFPALRALVHFLDRTRVDMLNLSRMDLQDTVITKALRKKPVRAFVLVGCRLPESVEHWPLGTEETLLDEVSPMGEYQIHALAEFFSRRRHFLSLSAHKHGRSFCLHLSRRSPVPLVQLVLDHSKLDDEGVQNMRVLSCLQHLSVQYNHLTARGASSLMPLLRMQLQYLNVGGNKLRRAGASVLAQHLPHRAVDDFTLGIHQTLLTEQGVTEVWNSVARRPLEALDLRRSQLRHPLHELLPVSANVASMEVDLRDNSGLDNENDLCSWAKKMNKVHTDIPLSIVLACQMLDKSPTLVLKEPRISLLNCGVAKLLKNDANVQVNLDNNALWRAEAAFESPRRASPGKTHRMKHTPPSTKIVPAVASPIKTAQSQPSKLEKCYGQRCIEPEKIVCAVKSLRRLLLRKVSSDGREVLLRDSAVSVPQLDLASSDLSLRGSEYVNYCRRFGAEELLLDTNFVETFGVAILRDASPATRRTASEGTISTRGDASKSRWRSTEDGTQCSITAGDLLALNHHLNSPTKCAH